MDYDPKPAERVFAFANGLVLILLAATILIPFMHQITLSLSTGDAAMSLGLHLIPDPRSLSLKSYDRILKATDLGRAYLWTILRTLLGTALTVGVSAMAAYPLAKRYLPMRTAFTVFIVFTMFFSGGLVPTYLLVRDLGLINTLWALVLPGLCDGFTIAILRNYMMGLPEELDESARMDGANELLIFWRIIFPLSTPVLATVSLWSIVGHWNSWFDALIYITKPQIKVLQSLLRMVLLETSFSFGGLENTQTALTGMRQERLAREYTPDTLKAAILMAVTLPILCVYPFIQKYFVRGILIGSLKG